MQSRHLLLLHPSRLFHSSSSSSSSSYPYLKPCTTTSSFPSLFHKPWIWSTSSLILQLPLSLSSASSFSCYLFTFSSPSNPSSPLFSQRTLPAKLFSSLELLLVSVRYLFFESLMSSIYHIYCIFLLLIFRPWYTMFIKPRSLLVNY